MSINRKNFLKTVGGVSLGLLAGPLAASSGSVFGASATTGSFALTQSEEKHLASFYKQLRTASFPLSENAIRGFQPASLVKRETRFRGYNLEFIAQNGTKVVLTRKKGRLISKCL